MYNILSSTKGKELLLQSQKSFMCNDNLNKTIKKQNSESSCGVASMAAVSNAWVFSEANANVSDIGPFDEEKLIPLMASIKPYDDVRRGGLTLDELHKLISGIFGDKVVVRCKRWSDTDTQASLDVFRQDIINITKSRGSGALIPNFLMNVIHNSWNPYGHFSPISAYEPNSDCILVADTYVPSYWIDGETMFKAMDTIDPTSGIKRGYLVIDWTGRLC